MRILHVLDHSLPLHSGYAFRTAAILREQRALGWTTMQMTTPRQGKSAAPVEDAGGFRFHRTPFAPNALSSAPGAIYGQEMRATARRLSELVAEFRPDVLHAHSPVLNALPALWVGRRRRVPVVYEVRASWEDAAVDHGTTRETSLRYAASRALESFAMRSAGHVTTICEGLRNEIAARGIAPDRITVIPNAVDTAEFEFGVAPDLALRDRLGLAGKTIIGFAGSFYAYEGLDLLVEALAMLRPVRPTSVCCWWAADRRRPRCRRRRRRSASPSASSSPAGCRTTRCSAITASSTCSRIRGIACASPSS
jgi:PEP-CTERM/exosortase A-associated glycosyltransferase